MKLTKRQNPFKGGVQTSFFWHFCEGSCIPLYTLTNPLPGVTVTESVPTEPNLRLTQSLSNLKADHSGPPRTPHPHANGTRKKKPAKLPPVITPSESQEQLPAVPQSASTTTSHPPSILSRTSSRERRMR
ncbi:hypothetical protein Y032_0179g705 [Ancylostoma ceylanicum]|uniref:Uncharacterized protein n=1 Tax=Ancylostoma ceylanicum TaxID=53326 RepID=A0A016STH1_9BILA|nr:hypothetical protein Y032_0179g705 [Ancylostoma ceylanicum]